MDPPRCRRGIKIGQQDRKTFALVYRTKIGDDLAGQDKGYKLHFIYGCKASPSEKGYKTVNDSLRRFRSLGTSLPRPSTSPASSPRRC